MDDTCEKNPFVKAAWALVTLWSKFDLGKLFCPKPLPGHVLRNLSHKHFEKRRDAAQEVETIVRQLSEGGDHERISAIITALVEDFALSERADHRKGGAFGLAATAVGLIGKPAQHLERIVPPVVELLQDKDSTVRFHSCLALHVIAKVARGHVVPFFRDVFEALCQLAADADASVRAVARGVDKLLQEIVVERVLSSEKQQQLPPEQQPEQQPELRRVVDTLVRQAGSTEEGTRLTAITWLRACATLGGTRLLSYAAPPLPPCGAEADETIRAVAKGTNGEQLAGVRARSIAEGLDVGAVLTIARREMKSQRGATRLEAFRLFSVLLNGFRPKVLSILKRGNILREVFREYFAGADEARHLTENGYGCGELEAPVDQWEGPKGRLSIVGGALSLQPPKARRTPGAKETPLTRHGSLGLAPVYHLYPFAESLTGV